VEDTGNAKVVNGGLNIRRMGNRKSKALEDPGGGDVGKSVDCSNQRTDLS
jgi:hypothetical protein